MSRTLTEEQSVNLAKLLIMMEIPEEDRLIIISAIDTQEEFLRFLNILSENNYEMTLEEVHQAVGQAVHKM